MPIEFHTRCLLDRKTPIFDKSPSKCWRKLHKTGRVTGLKSVIASIICLAKLCPPPLEHHMQAKFIRVMKLLRIGLIPLDTSFTAKDPKLQTVSVPQSSLSPCRIPKDWLGPTPPYCVDGVQYVRNFAKRRHSGRRWIEAFSIYYTASCEAHEHQDLGSHMEAVIAPPPRLRISVRLSKTLLRHLAKNLLDIAKCATLYHCPRFSYHWVADVVECN